MRKSKIPTSKSQQNPKSKIPKKTGDVLVYLADPGSSQKYPGQGNGQRPYDLKERTLEFALRILEVAGKLPLTPEGRTVRSQMADSGTSVGANTEEGDGAISRAEKRRFFSISRREARETRYWLKIIDRRWPDLINVKPDIQEATEILHILSSIIQKLE